MLTPKETQQLLQEVEGLRAKMKIADEMAELLSEVVGSGGVVKERALDEATALLKQWRAQDTPEMNTLPPS